MTGPAVGLLVIVLLVFGGCGGDPPKGTIALVGETPITQERFDEMKSLYEAAGRGPDEHADEDEHKRFEQSIAGYLVMIQVLEQEAASRNISVTDSRVQAEITKIKQMFQGDEKKFEDALKKQNLNLEQLTQQARDRILLDDMKAAVTADVTVSEAEAKAYYQANKAAYVRQEEREVRHILITGAAGGGAGAAGQIDWDAAKTVAEKVRADIQNGADFAVMAGKYSVDETSKESGGELGAISRGQLSPAFEESVFSLKKREVSKPVKTQYGYHIIQVTDITSEEQLSYEQVQEVIKTILLEQKRTRVWEEWLAGKEKQLGVTYRSGLKPETTTTTATEGGSDGTDASSAASSKSTPPKSTTAGAAKSDGE